MTTGQIHNRLAVLRVDRGWSRQELAERVGVNYQTVGYIERGDYAPSLELALRIARTFGVAVEAVFGLEPLPPLTDGLAVATATAAPAAPSEQPPGGGSGNGSGRTPRQQRQRQPQPQQQRTGRTGRGRA